MRRILSVVGVGLVIAALVPVAAFASSSGGSGLPWESPLQMLEDSIKGPVAYGISLLGIVGSGGMLVFGGEISEFTRRIMYLVMVVGLIAGASSLMSTMFSTAALVS
jgi:type IV secretory pathway VirB2 component (pilin)